MRDGVGIGVCILESECGKLLCRWPSSSESIATIVRPRQVRPNSGLCATEAEDEWTGYVTEFK